MSSADRPRSGPASSGIPATRLATGTVASGPVADTFDAVVDPTGDYLSGFSRAPRIADRYELLEQIGAGAQGCVLRVRDRVLRRDVAMKELNASPAGFHPSAINRFVAEAQLTAQLAHPHIIPIYDAGITEDGRPFYTMPLLPRQTLEHVLDALRAGDAETHERYARVVLLRHFTATCMAMQAAHDGGVVHRDLKPANLILGPTGELLVTDFGLAALFGDRLAREGSVPGEEALAGSPLGTPLYMSPEQARGDLPAIGPASDIYSLGAILYELLTLQVPIEHDAFLLQIMAVEVEEPLHPCERTPERDVPRDLADLAMRCLAKDPADRPSRAADLVREVDAWLEGTRERQRRHLEAERLVGEARALLDGLDPKREEAEIARAVATAAWLEVPEHAPLADKERVWLLDDEARERETDCERTEREAIVALEAALRQVETHPEARRQLAALHFTRMERCELARAPALAAEEARRAERAGGAPMVQRIHAPARLRVVTEPPGVPWAVDRYLEQHRQLVPDPVRLPPIGPRGEALLTPGSYVVRAGPAGAPPVPVPVLLRRGDDRELLVDTRLGDGLPGHMALIHGGPTVLGGDADAGRRESARELTLASFALGRVPITCAEYLEFLRDVGERDLYEALSRAPRPSASAPPYWQAGDSGNLELPERDEQGDTWDPRYPVLGISALDAEAYVAWRSLRDGLPYRLCRDHEWERAARGADGRLYPWGHHFDPALCKMRLSRSGRMSPEPVGSFPTDVSPFGVRDLAGGIADWTASAYRDDPRDRCIRGGAWSTRAHRCMATFRGSMLETDTSGDLGFRLALDVPLR